MTRNTTILRHGQWSPSPLRASRAVLLLFVCLTACLSSCKDKAQRIVDDAIQTHGGPSFRSFVLSFDFRDRHYTAIHDKGLFTYTREFTDSTGQIRDVLDNEGFTRYRNGVVDPITEERKQAYTRSVNSVIYFTLLPFKLNDDAARKEWIGDITVREQPYDVIRVTFAEEGGGEDHQDVFLFWIHSDQKTMDYFAYSYVTEGGGLRFREAVNRRRVGDLLLQDYINYKPAESVPLDSLMPLFIAGQLQRLSEIRMENVSVRHTDVFSQLQR